MPPAPCLGPCERLPLWAASCSPWSPDPGRVPDPQPWRGRPWREWLEGPVALPSGPLCLCPRWCQVPTDVGRRKAQGPWYSRTGKWGGPRKEPRACRAGRLLAPIRAGAFAGSLLLIFRSLRYTNWPEVKMEKEVGSGHLRSAKEDNTCDRTPDASEDSCVPAAGLCPGTRGSAPCPASSRLAASAASLARHPGLSRHSRRACGCGPLPPTRGCPPTVGRRAPFPGE